jgi:hypothetical protein
MIEIDCSVLTQSMVFFIEVEYQNCMSSYSQYSDANPKDQCRVQYVAEEDEVSDDIEIELLQKSLDVEIFQQYNNLSVLVKADFEEVDDEMLGSDYEGVWDFITGAEFEDDELRKYFTIEPLDGDKMTVNTSSDLRDYFTADQINKIINKSKYSSRIIFTYIKSDGTEGTYTTKSALTINIKRSYPSVKVGKLVINPYLADTGVPITPSIEGYKVDGSDFGLDDSKTIPKGIEYEWIDGGNIVITSELNTSVKSGKIPVKVWADYDYWCLPQSNYLEAEIPYTVKTVMPKIKINGAKTKTLNPTVSVGSRSDQQFFNFTILDDPLKDYGYTYTKWQILDSKNNDVTGKLSISIESFYAGNKLLYVSPNPGTLPGQTYKIRLYTENDINGQNTSGSAAVLTLKTLGAKEAEKVSATLSVKGTMDAMKPDTSMNLTFNFKNSGGLIPKDIRFFTADGAKEDVTPYFYIRGTSAGKYIIQEKYSYALLSAGLAGKKVLINATFEYGIRDSSVKKEFSLTKTVTIKASTVTPKFAVTKATLNPYVDSGVDFALEYGFADVSRYYYNISYDVLVGGEVLEQGKTARTGIIYIPGDVIRSAKGKTIEIKAVPARPMAVPSSVTIKEFKNATCKLTVLGDAKAKVTCSVKAKGSIDAIKDTSYVIVNMTVKNAYSPSFETFELAGLDVYRMEKGERVSYSDCIMPWSYPGLKYGFALYKNPDSTRVLEPGSYKCDMKIAYASGYDEEEGKYERAYTNVTFSFKVVRGSVTLTANKKQLELLNNNTRRDTVTFKAKDTSVNPVSKVEVADANSPFKAYYLGNGKVSIGFKDGRYTEMKSGKPITAAVTKSVKLNVYFIGSSKPNTVTLKVKINP